MQNRGQVYKNTLFVKKEIHVFVKQHGFKETCVGRLFIFYAKRTKTADLPRGVSSKATEMRCPGTTLLIPH